MRTDINEIVNINKLIAIIVKIEVLCPLWMKARTI